MRVISRNFRVFLKCTIPWELSQSEIIAGEKNAIFILFTAIEKLGLVVLLCEFILALYMKVYFDNNASVGHFVCYMYKLPIVLLIF